jgi:hypothetical protein
MRRLCSVFFALTTLAALTVFTPSAGQAESYAWCAAYGSKFGGSRNCGFVTLAQCRETILGMGGFCERNLFYTGPAERSAKHARKHKHHDG